MGNAIKLAVETIRKNQRAREKSNKYTLSPENTDIQFEVLYSSSFMAIFSYWYPFVNWKICLVVELMIFEAF